MLYLYFLQLAVVSIFVLVFKFYSVVTGASQGIGRGYALEVYQGLVLLCVLLSVLNLFLKLARQGLNVVIISRSGSKLEKVKDEIGKVQPKHERFM